MRNYAQATENSIPNPIYTLKAATLKAATLKAATLKAATLKAATLKAATLRYLIPNINYNII
ncbi:hypothetical protein [Streptococcus vestibularis]|uniref:hypothetical protein n=1 Tax=Streptococcus vestibularis TaxID=1343 RepID=UPI000E446ECE|nr:hypothetical protein [Streptococcus vestibularis]RGM51937.1 hypothetical protein DXC09_06480 [Streptococcus vestibularis]